MIAFPHNTSQSERNVRFLSTTRHIPFSRVQAAIAAFASARSASSLDKEKDRDRGLGTTPEKPLPAPRLAEEDLVSFRVRLSVEGYPQAACVRRLRKFVGIIQRRPSGDINGERLRWIRVWGCGHLRVGFHFLSHSVSICVVKGQTDVRNRTPTKCAQ